LDPITARIKFECGEEIERTVAAKHRRMYMKAGRHMTCPAHDCDELIVSIEEIRVPTGWEAFKESIEVPG
jgi:hypothetical protein